MENEPLWEEFGSHLLRIKVDGGWLYSLIGSSTITYVPDVDLRRYQAHLRDAYNQGFKDGTDDTLANAQRKPL